ncbi:hypothetical protein HBI56_082840 [Parastagonospora nodorum]|uniref:Uncharacterized protein n=1 Tax=Phaeosphaeria nodorum (strain SN15 / ATCC MYA-4574 / FGSC 10173) TaxID=321614 RepID=A0A7U2FG87_PHANO|nr:hypothetical protein HBH56_103750 [Parastagonospora nodorum]QRD04633.1 hypothetical protein JI435_421500 [Parastagonospora nodorum SN15]KAH3929337.1 hypothetical protein HBH54_126680 [Parastagonospora nodorum]KAH3951730.1 hypothetical protein HBH53_060700 [Parastagonospora nodorum]KAH3975323.1 hypothetical protein HBH52_126170 [Parastagonospora nodorum]
MLQCSMYVCWLLVQVDHDGNTRYQMSNYIENYCSERSDGIACSLISKSFRSSSWRSTSIVSVSVLETVRFGV